MQHLMHLCGLLGVLLVGCAEEPPDGQSLFVSTGCARCHEVDGSGGSEGPPLKGLKAHWTEEKLVQFLTDPPAYVKNDARLQKWREEYFTPMPRLVIGPEKRKILAKFVLEAHP